MSCVKYSAHANLHFLHVKQLLEPEVSAYIKGFTYAHPSIFSSELKQEVHLIYILTGRGTFRSNPGEPAMEPKLLEPAARVTNYVDILNKLKQMPAAGT